MSARPRTRAQRRADVERVKRRVSGYGKARATVPVFSTEAPAPPSAREVGKLAAAPACSCCNGRDRRLLLYGVSRPRAASVSLEVRDQLLDLDRDIRVCGG